MNQEPNTENPSNTPKSLENTGSQEQPQGPETQHQAPFQGGQPDSSQEEIFQPTQAEDPPPPSSDTSEPSYSVPQSTSPPPSTPTTPVSELFKTADEDRSGKTRRKHLSLPPRPEQVGYDFAYAFPCRRKFIYRTHPSSTRRSQGPSS